MKKVLCLVMATLMTLSLTACGNGSSETESKELNMLLYPDYVPESVIEAFEEETGITVNVDYVDNDTMIYTKWSESPKGYDLSQPNISTLHAMMDAGMLKELDLENIPNNKYISTEACDPAFEEEDNKYAIPYNVSGGYTWIYNPETCPIEITCVDDLLKDEMKDQLVTMPYSYWWYPIALKHLGYSETSTDETEIAEATEWVKKLVANVKVFDGATPSTSVENGECSVALSFASDSARALMEDPNLEVLYLDDMIFTAYAQYWVVGSESPNAVNAEKFINFICDPENYAECISTYPALSVNEEALKYVSDDFKKVEDMFDVPEGVSLLDFNTPADALSLYDEQWNQIMTQ